jgi:hypothetical protein
MARIITREELLKAMDQIGADQDEDDVYIIGGTLVSYMGIKDEFILYQNTTFFKDGISLPLLPELRKTGHGLAVNVIGEEEEPVIPRRPARYLKRELYE